MAVGLLSLPRRPTPSHFPPSLAAKWWEAHIGKGTALDNSKQVLAPLRGNNLPSSLAQLQHPMS
eukprot:920390-Pyramimonas_sp.AAC.1